MARMSVRASENDEQKWNPSLPLELASFITPPMFDQIENDLHVNLFCISKQGDLLLLGEKGRVAIVNLVSGQPKLRELQFDQPLIEKGDGAIHYMSFNSAGDKVLFRGDYFLKVMVLPRRGFKGELLPEPPVLSDVLVTFNDGKTKLVRLQNIEGLKMNDHKEAISRCISQGITNIKSISREIYRYQVSSLGYYYPKGSRITQALWYPLADSYVVVLDDTRKLYLYNIMEQCQEPEQTIPLNVPAGTNGTPITFCFGSDRGWERFTCYILLSSGATFALCPFLPYQCTIKALYIKNLKDLVNGQLAVAKRNKKDTETLDHDIAVLKAQRYWLENVWIEKTIEKGRMHRPRFGAPLDSDSEEEVEDHPPHHSVIADDKVMSSLDSKITGISSSTWPLSLQGPIKALPSSIIEGKEGEGGASGQGICAISSEIDDTIHNAKPILARIYSSGHLELLLLDHAIAPAWEMNSPSSKISCPSALLVRCLDMGIDDSGGIAELKSDPCHPDLLYCHHSTGVHLIMLPWAKSINQLTAKSLNSVTVRQIFAVSPEECAVNSRAVVGVQLFDTPNFGHILLVRLSTGCIEAINVTINRHLTSRKHKVSEDHENAIESPVDEIVPFADIVNEIQAKWITTKAKVSGNTPLNQIDDATVEFLIKRVKEFQEVPVMHILELKEKMKGRLELFSDSFTLQTEELAKIRSTLQAEKKKSQSSKERMKEIFDAHDNLKRRAAAVLQALQDNQPVVSKAEREYHQLLEQIKAHLLGLSPKATELSIRASRILANKETFHISKATSLPNDHKKMCFDVLSAEKLLLSEAQTSISSLEEKLKKLSM